MANVPRSLGTMGARGIQFMSPAEAYRFADAVWQADLAPKGFKNAQAVYVAIQMGMELGLPPMASVQNIAVINGRPSLWGDAMLGLCQQSGIFDNAVFEEGWRIDPKEGTTAFCRVRRLPHGNVIERTFSEVDVKLAGLAAKGGPHQQYPKRMMQMRARSWALRDAFPDVLRGLLTAEEAGDVIDVQPAPRRQDVKPAGKALENLADKIDRRKAPPVEAVEVASAPASPAPEAAAPPQEPAWKIKLKAALVDAKSITDVQKAFTAHCGGLKGDEEAEASSLCAARIDEIRGGRGQRAGGQKSMLP